MLCAVIPFLHLSPSHALSFGHCSSILSHSGLFFILNENCLSPCPLLLFVCQYNLADTSAKAMDIRFKLHGPPQAQVCLSTATHTHLSLLSIVTAVFISNLYHSFSFNSQIHLCCIRGKSRDMSCSILSSCSCA